MASADGALPIDAAIATAKIAAQRQLNLEHNGEKIGPFDMLVAAQAPQPGVTLVMHQSWEFSRVPGRSREDEL